MGMYTELVLKCRLKKELPEEAKLVLSYMFSDGDRPKTLPNHAFFAKPRWDYIGTCASYYHHPKAVNSAPKDDWCEYHEYLFSRSDIKNYDGEIASFIDWLKPYLDHENGDCVGWSWYEEEQVPTLIIY